MSGAGTAVATCLVARPDKERFVLTNGTNRGCHSRSPTPSESAKIGTWRARRRYRRGSTSLFSWSFSTRIASSYGGENLRWNQ